MTGIDHTAAPIDIRTVFSFTKKNTAEALKKLKQVQGVKGCVLLSTCNRMELWLSTDDTFEASPLELLCELKKTDAAAYRQYFRFRSGEEAVHHLFRLAGGLESRILGEDQIVTQVKDALSMAREHYAADHVLETLFRQAVTAAKKVKSTIPLSSSDKSAVDAAVAALYAQGCGFRGKKCLVIGNGVMGRLAATRLQREGAEVTVTVRQYRSGVVEIPEHCARIDYGRRMELFGDCDYVLSATVSPNFTLTRELVEQHIRKPVILIDLAVPRDIEPAVRGLPGVTLFDIDCFREEAVSEQQKEAIAQAEACFAEHMREFSDWYHCVEMIPRIQNLKKLEAEDMTARLTKELRALPLSVEEREALRREIGAAAGRSMNRLLFGLRESVSESAFLECLEGLEKVYGASAGHLPRDGQAHAEQLT